MTIMVVEDNETLARSMARSLRRLGHRVEFVTTLAAARQLMGEQQILAACLDIDLPDGSGLDLLENELRRTDPPLPAVIVTGAAANPDRMRAARSGALALLVKPFALAELGSILDHALKHTTGEPESTEGDTP